MLDVPAASDLVCGALVPPSVFEVLPVAGRLEVPPLAGKLLVNPPEPALVWEFQVPPLPSVPPWATPEAPAGMSLRPADAAAES